MLWHCSPRQNPASPGRQLVPTCRSNCRSQTGSSRGQATPKPERTLQHRIGANSYNRPISIAPVSTSGPDTRALQGQRGALAGRSTPCGAHLNRHSVPAQLTRSREGKGVRAISVGNDQLDLHRANRECKRAGPYDTFRQDKPGVGLAPAQIDLALVRTTAGLGRTHTLNTLHRMPGALLCLPRYSREVLTVILAGTRKQRLEEKVCHLHKEG